ncbi:MAG TPA: hypothetical protein VN915_07800 [Elusimicrobiota bacterium]|nr:hypothetical protein [Elusimicrobiota bacterium]
MAELVVRFDVRFGKNAVRLLTAGAMFFAVVPELASESITLTTYYPAPSGVYSQLITTGNTYLARDGGAVRVGSSIAPAYTLDVNGTGHYSSNLQVDGNETIGGNGTIAGTLTVSGVSYLNKIITTGGNVATQVDPSAADLVIGSSNNGGVRHDSSIMYWSNASASRIFNSADVFYLSVWNANPTTGANIILAANGGPNQMRGALGIGSTLPTNSGHSYVYIDNSNTGCSEIDAAGTINVCGAGNYAAYQPGVYVEGWSYHNRGGQVGVQDTAGSFSTQVWGLNTATGSIGWKTLTKDDSSDHLFCCPK